MKLSNIVYSEMLLGSDRVNNVNMLSYKRSVGSFVAELTDKVTLVQTFGIQTEEVHFNYKLGAWVNYC